MRVIKAGTLDCFCGDEHRWCVESRSSVGTLQGQGTCELSVLLARSFMSPGSTKRPLGARAPTLGSWSSGIENRTDWLNVSWAWLLFMMETVFFTTCPGRTAPNFTILLAGSRTKICGTRKTAGREGLSVNEKNKHHTPILVSLGRSLSFGAPHSSH